MNPNKKNPEARHNGDQLVLLPLVHHCDEDADENINDGVAAAAVDTNSIAGFTDSDRDVILAKNHLLQQYVKDIKNEMISILPEYKQFIVTINSNVCFIPTQPAVCHSVVSLSSARATNPVQLSMFPRSLYLL